MKHVIGVLVSGLVAFAACDREGPVALDQGTPTGATPGLAAQGDGDPYVLGLMAEANEQLRTMGLNVAVESIEFYTIGQGRPSNRIHAQEFRWVANDPRRLADGENITYIVDQSGGATASGLTNAQTEPAIDSGMNTWDAHKSLKKVDVVKRADPGSDVTIFDAFFGFGGFGDPFAADIVNAGWLPRAFFEAVGGPGGGRGILAFSVTFIFVDDVTGVPTDINGDNRLDSALNEVYYNDTFGDPADDRAGNPWGIDIALPGIDVETVALHENGHSLGLGHFGPPPAAVMNPVYAGILHDPLSTDGAGMQTVWGSWPK
jgi:hypothetical protein